MSNEPNSSPSVDSVDYPALDFSRDWAKTDVPPELGELIRRSPKVIFPRSRDEVVRMAMGDAGSSGVFEVGYEVPGKGFVVEASVVRCRNGLAINYTDAYMRRRDPDCMVIGDELPTDKDRFAERYGGDFGQLRAESLDWLAGQELIVMPFTLGTFAASTGCGGILVAPANAGFFAGGLGDLQEMLPAQNVPTNFRAHAMIYLAPPFRHTHFDGRQVVVHNRSRRLHEIFSYNLYPGPSAKKGVYGVLLAMGEREGWLTLHGSTVQAVTPYDNVTTIMHEGASGSGKSEMLEHPHREEDGRLLLGRNLVTGECRHVALNQACALRRVSDDMAMVHPSMQNSSGYMTICDAEAAWFVRLDHIQKYGTDPHLEQMTIHTSEPLIFINVRGAPDSTCLIWEHSEDEPGKPCPNPRVILPRRFDPAAVNGGAEVMIRNFGIRTPPCTRQNPSYGIVGYLHLLPPALAWLWRLVAPRGHANPSITDSAGMTSEGVGSYWPFATGRQVDHANLLLRHIQATPAVRYTLTPNQHVGAWKTGFMPQWIAREYLGRRGVARFPRDKIAPARCPLLGYTLKSMQVEGTSMPDFFLRVEEQPEVTTEGYDRGRDMLEKFFARELALYSGLSLDPMGRQIIECFNDGGKVSDYESIMPSIDAAAPAVRTLSLTPQCD